MKAATLQVHFVRLAVFDRTARSCLTDEDERAMEQEIANSPTAAPVISETGGVRNIRVASGRRRIMNTTTTSKAKGKKGKTGARSLGSLAIEALQEAVSFKRGAKTGATVRKVTARRACAEPAPEFEADQIAALRKQLGLSQPVFAEALNVSAAAVKAWEQGMNAPGGAALRLLEIAGSHPEIILERVGSR